VQKLNDETGMRASLKNKSYEKISVSNFKH
jgi:hypothetical protein